MASIAAERPSFFALQYLSAVDLNAIVDYLRTTAARQNLGQHSWGIAVGLDLVSQPVTDTTVEYYVQPGVAVDGYGRIIVVSNPTRIEAGQFVGVGSGNVDVWIRYDETDLSATRPGFNACSAQDSYARAGESFAIEVGGKTSILDRQSGITVNDQLLVDAREALISVDPDAQLLCDGAVPHQQLPVDDATARWLVPLGHVHWSAADNAFLPLVDPAAQQALDSGAGTQTPDQVYEALMASRAKRRLLGVVAESLFAAQGLIRLRERTDEPDPAGNNDAVCRARQVKTSDLHYCDGRLKPKELVWLEGNVRVTGDARLLDGRLEFRDAAGRDYLERTVDGALVSPIVPALMQRADNNPRHGTDLQVLLGGSEDGRNRFTIGSITFSGSDICNPGSVVQNAVVIQDNGLVGIGTTNPDSLLEAPLTMRGRAETVVENEGTEDETSYDIYRLASFEADSGVTQWQLDLWDVEGTERKGLNLTETGLAQSRLFLAPGGDVGIGTVDPAEQLHVVGDAPAVFIDINSLSGTPRSRLEFGSDGVERANVHWHKNNDRLVLHHDGEDSLVINGDLVGLGTGDPLTTLHLFSGNDVTLADNAGYLLIGDVNADNLVVDVNEIQARNNGATQGLHVQAHGGEFSIHHWDTSRRFTVADDGDVGIGTSAPLAKLDVRGDVRFGNTAELRAVGGAQGLRTVAGRVAANGNEEVGTGYSVSKGPLGQYTITFSPGFTAHPIVVANAHGNPDNILSVTVTSNSTALIQVTDIRDRNEDPGSTAATQAEDRAFNFIAMGAR
ncbi:hypothetical protein E4634_01080 [Mangrovimicrobium sediminis]|uniref:Uncharacterized protein n=1 Tax=Mangrovimicrobium sediminis TaxID=2562682 RepID=A0A4Z0M9G6_9GAMM|nr:hypothetical protein [Haliea sp. SAOS-164]TGD76171.1 hypothetical protein E4634_01080 [Haliea sp. SAOS-164]